MHFTNLPLSFLDFGLPFSFIVNGTAAATVKTNNLLRLGTGIYTAGPCLLTSFICNNLDSCYYGFFFGESTSLSDQSYTAAKNNLNRWMGDYSDNNCNYWRRMMTDSGNIQNPVIDWFYTTSYNNIYRPGFELCQSHPLKTTLVDEIYSTRITNICSFDSTVYDPFSVNGTDERMQMFSEIADDNTSYLSNEELYKEIDKELLYNILKVNPAMMYIGDSADAKYQSFYSSMSSSDIGMLSIIYKAIDTGAFETARYLNNSLPEDDIWYRYRKSVNEIYLNSWCEQVYDFELADGDTLLKIALGSPYEWGDAVFTARVLLGLDPDRIPLPQSAVAEPHAVEYKEITFYPNPAMDKVCFSVTHGEVVEETEYKYRINDIFGRLVGYGKCHNYGSDQCIMLPSQLSEGLYIVQVIENQNLIGTGKVLIRK